MKYAGEERGIMGDLLSNISQSDLEAILAGDMESLDVHLQLIDRGLDVDLHADIAAKVDAKAIEVAAAQVDAALGRR